jgi:hypothetical protein
VAARRFIVAANNGDFARQVEVPFAARAHDAMPIWSV